MKLGDLREKGVKAWTERGRKDFIKVSILDMNVPQDLDAHIAIEDHSDLS
jgi:hypothetical protein